MQKPRRKRSKKLPTQPMLPAVVRSPEEKRSAYRILSTGMRKMLAGRRILEDNTADLSQYEDTRVPTKAGKPLKNPFKAYPWRNNSYDTRKG